MSKMFKVKYLPTAPDETSNNEHNVQGKISSDGSKMTRLIMSKMFKPPDDFTGCSCNHFEVKSNI